MTFSMGAIAASASRWRISPLSRPWAPSIAPAVGGAMSLPVVERGNHAPGDGDSQAASRSEQVVRSRLVGRTGRDGAHGARLWAQR